MGGTWYVDGERADAPPERGPEGLLGHARRMAARCRWDEHLYAFWRNVLGYYLNGDGGGNAA